MLTRIARKDSCLEICNLFLYELRGISEDDKPTCKLSERKLPGRHGACRPSWFVDSEDNVALLDEELVEALRDETARAVLRDVSQLSEQERKIVLAIVRQLQETSG